MLKVYLAAVAIMTLSYTSSARLEPLGGNVERFAATFNNISKEMKLKQRVALNSCDKDAPKSCIYGQSEELSIMLNGGENSDSTEDLSLAFSGGDIRNTVDLLGSLAVIMKLYAPRATADERGVVFKSLINEKLKAGSSTKTSLHGLQFTAAIVPGMGLWMTVKRGD
jgi:hypothetical protein